MATQETTSPHDHDESFWRSLFRNTSLSMMLAGGVTLILAFAR